MFKNYRKKKTEKQFEFFLSKIDLIQPDSISYDKIKYLKSLKNKAHLIQMNNLIDFDDFIKPLKDVKVHYAKSNNATELVSSDKFGNFVKNIMPYDNEKYVFHNILRDKNICEIMPKLISIPRFINKKSINDLRISRLYAGGKYSGTNLHIHSQALNYLVSGRKLWIMFPYNESNNRFVEQNNMLYGTVTSTTLKWFLESHEILTNSSSIIGLNIFIQETKEVVYIPSGSHHAVINLDNSLGITYSWV